MKPLVLVLDDEPNVRDALFKHLVKNGYEVKTAASLEKANNIIKAEFINYAIVDLKIDYSSEYGGIKFISNINKLHPRAKVIILSAFWLTSDMKHQLQKTYYHSFVPKGGQHNYIKAVIEELNNLKTAPPQRSCFVIMPFSDTSKCKSEQWTEIFENMIKPAVKDFGNHYKCYKACLDIGNIIKDILSNLNQADVVIADLTDKNPNVFYELGVRHALRNTTILITQSFEDVPFDLKHYALVKYDWTTRKGREEFSKSIGRILRHFEDNPDNSILTSPVLEYLSLESND